MEHPARILSAFSILIIACLMAAGCSSSEGSSQTAPTETTASTGPQFSEGDIVQMQTGSATTGYLILGYDAGTDSYTRAIIHKNTNGAWGYRTSSATSTIDREELEKVFSVVAHVSVSAIPTSAPTPVPTSVVATQAPTVIATATTVKANTTGKPIIRSIDPEEGYAGDSLDMTITGSNFQDGATAKLTMSGQDAIDATDVSVDSASKITCTFDIPDDATVGTWSVAVTNSNGQSGELTNYFIVHKAKETNPTVSSITPKSGYQGDTIDITITGTGFKDGATAALIKTDQDDITASDVTVSSATKIIATFYIPSDAKTGTWGVIVTNSDDLSGKLTAIFTVYKSSS